MTERNILRIKREYIDPKIDKINKFYYLNINKYLIRDHNIEGNLKNGEFIIGILNGVYSKDGDILLKTNEKNKFKTYILKNRFAQYNYMIIISDEIILKYSLNEKNYLDLTFIKIIKKDIEEIIYPNIGQWGLKEINPKNIIEISNKINNYTNSIYEV